ncbi:putative oxidoreductase [bacterium YEK0313]|nr:putative oxidoreductase [bacterium YEK0313]
MMTSASRPLAVVTGASTGIGYELAKLAAEKGYDLVIASNDGQLEVAAQSLRKLGAVVHPVDVDLATMAGVDTLYDVVGGTGQPVAALLANAGKGAGHAFLDEEVDEWRRVIETNVTGTLYLIHRVGRDMRRDGMGRILITGSIAGFMPGPFQAVYNGSKAFIDSFAFALRNELEDTGVTVTCLMPGATETEFFARAGMLDTKLGQAEKDDPADVARTGFEAMLNGEGDVVSGWMNKVRAAFANIVPAEMLAAQHRKMAAPGTGKSSS